MLNIIRHSISSDLESLGNHCIFWLISQFNNAKCLPIILQKYILTLNNFLLKKKYIMFITMYTNTSENIFMLTYILKCDYRLYFKQLLF